MKVASRATAPTKNVHPSLELGPGVCTAIRMTSVKAVFASRASATHERRTEHRAPAAESACRDTALTERGVHPKMELGKRVSIAITMTIVKAVFASAPLAMTAGFVQTGRL